MNSFIDQLPTECLQNCVTKKIDSRILSNGIVIENRAQSILLGLHTTHSWYISVPAQAIIKEPVSIPDLIAYSPSTIIEKIDIHVGQGAQITFTDFALFTQVHIKNSTIKIESYAQVVFISEYKSTQDIFQYIYLKASLQDYSAFNLKGHVACSGTIVFLCEVQMDGQQSQASAHITTISLENGHCSIETKQQHSGFNSTSTVTVKQLVEDASVSHSDSLVDILPSAKHAVAHQKHKALLLSKLAKAYANPQLKVQYNNQVQCSHGSAISKLDDVLLWYLMTKGISQSQARLLLLEGFFADSGRNSNEGSTNFIEQYLIISTK